MEKSAPDYFIMYNPLTFNLMDIPQKSRNTPYDGITYLSNKDASRLSQDNYLDYLPFDLCKKRETMVETFAMETYATIYVANILADAVNDREIILADDVRRSLKEVILEKQKKPKAVFITSMSANFPTAAFTALILNHGNIPVVLGGIHVSAVAGDVDTFIRDHAPHPEIISQVIGSGDSKTLLKIARDLDKGKLKPVYRGNLPIEDGVWRPRKNVTYMAPMQVEALARIPVFGPMLSRKFRILPFAPFLGCPYSCKFCSISALDKKSRKLTMRSAHDILEELKSFQEKGGFENRFIFFLPDNLLLGGKRLEAVLDGIIENNIRINFAAQISIEIADNDRLLKKLRDAGATHFFIGFESLDLDNLVHIQKHSAKDIAKNNLCVSDYYTSRIRKIQNHGISIHGAFILGLPNDYFFSFSQNTAKDIVRFCIQNHIGIQPATLTDLPGSAFFEESQKNDLWLYGKKGTMDYLLSLCLADLSETNRKVPQSLDHSPLTLLYMGFQSVRDVGDSRHAIKNAFFMFMKSFFHPAKRGRISFKERLLDAVFSFAIQLYIALYKDVGEKLAHSSCGIRGSFERLFDEEKDTLKKIYFKRYVDALRENPGSGILQSGELSGQPEAYRR